MRFLIAVAIILSLTAGVAQQPDSQQADAQKQASQTSAGNQDKANNDSSAPAPTPGSAKDTPSDQKTDEPASKNGEPSVGQASGTESSNDAGAKVKDGTAQPGAGATTAEPKEGEKTSVTPGPDSQPGTGSQQNAAAPEAANALATQRVDPSKQQPKRILGIMPNYRAVSAGEIPPPPTPKQAFKVATQNSFDYSSFVFVGVTSAMAEGTDAHPQLGKGMNGFGRYYWRGFLDKTDGNYLVIFALPTVFHQDERYFAMGEGGFWKRAAYSSTRVLITPNYHGHNSFNFSEVLGRGLAQGISREYYPTKDRTLGALAVKYGYAIGRDSVTNVFREFWPDIATHVLHRHP